MSLQGVQAFWNTNLCGKHFIQAEYPSKEFFEQYRDFRYQKEHHLNRLIDWSAAANKDVLEIGLGVGADACQWAKHAATYTGVDLTREAVEATERHLALLGLRGRVEQGNAESLNFEEGTFDLVFSHGVLHHTTDIERSFNEVHRVLRPKGECILMLYAKNSFNYWVRIQQYFRLRFLVELLKDKLGVPAREPWSEHISNFRTRGWRYFSWREWPHHCTDGAGCKIANMYSNSEIRKMLTSAGLDVTRMHKAHFPMGGAFQRLESFLGKYLGFYQFVWSVKR